MNVNHNMKIKNQVGRTEELTTVLLITIINMRSPPVLLIAIINMSLPPVLLIKIINIGLPPHQDHQHGPASGRIFHQAVWKIVGGIFVRSRTPDKLQAAPRLSTRSFPDYQSIQDYQQGAPTLTYHRLSAGNIWDYQRTQDYQQESMRKRSWFKWFHLYWDLHPSTSKNGKCNFNIFLTILL